MIIVCKDCQKRYPGCHTGCEWYKAERKAQNKENESRRLESIVKDTVSTGWCYDKRGVKR